ncbi:hypothetical protein LTR15_008840 [Elasticomyces elasticus]|nr:hypothetical protein LTR15_008840 [Elasticomyces elasticus]
MADTDGDSHMDSPPDLFDQDVETPIDQFIDPSTMSPPDSQHHAPGANSNGKRPLNTISNGNGEDPNAAIDLAGAAPVMEPRAPKKQDFPEKKHQSGYTWDRFEDEPGYQWLSKKALDERNRAWDSMVHKDHMVKNRYGDVFEMAEKEQAMLNSLKQQ